MPHISGRGLRRPGSRSRRAEAVIRAERIARPDPHGRPAASTRSGRPLTSPTARASAPRRAPLRLPPSGPALRRTRGTCVGVGDSRSADGGRTGTSAARRRADAGGAGRRVAPHPGLHAGPGRRLSGSLGAEGRGRDPAGDDVGLAVLGVRRDPLAVVPDALGAAALDADGAVDVEVLALEDRAGEDLARRGGVDVGALRRTRSASWSAWQERRRPWRPRRSCWRPARPRRWRRGRCGGACGSWWGRFLVAREGGMRCVSWSPRARALATAHLGVDASTPDRLPSTTRRGSFKPAAPGADCRGQ